MTLNEALILSYVKRGIGYGYHIMTHVRASRSDEWVEFSRAGLYKTLEKLDKLGYIHMELERDGARPPKKVYSITPSGEKELADFLQEGFRFEYRMKNDLDAYLVTAVAASPDAADLLDRLRRRHTAVEEQIRVLEEDWPEHKESYPLIVYALYRKRCESLEQERRWLVWLEKILSNISGDILSMTWEDANRVLS